MGANSKIQWTDATFNPWRGCTKVSPGCTNCYADAQAKRNPGTLGIWGPKGTRVLAGESMWRSPLKWELRACATGQRLKVFCASMADVFEDFDNQVVDHHGARLWFRRKDPMRMPVDCDSPLPPEGFAAYTLDEARERLFDLIRATPHLDWQLLTKHPERFAHCLPWFDIPGGLASTPWPNVWLGVSVEDQQRADERIPILLSTPAAVRFLSCEPLLGPVDLKPRPPELRGKCLLFHPHDGPCRTQGLDWVIVGGESGPGARACNVRWVRDIVRQCAAAGVPCFVKQMGAHPYQDDKAYSALTLHDPKGGDPVDWPEDLRVRQFPEVRHAS